MVERPTLALAFVAGAALLVASWFMAWHTVPVSHWQDEQPGGCDPILPLCGPGLPAWGFDLDVRINLWGLAFESDGDVDRSHWIELANDDGNGRAWIVVAAALLIGLGILAAIVAGALLWNDPEEARVQGTQEVADDASDRAVEWALAAGMAVVIGVLTFSWAVWYGLESEGAFDQWRAGFWIGWIGTLIVAGVAWTTWAGREPQSNSSEAAEPAESVSCDLIGDADER